MPPQEITRFLAEHVRLFGGFPSERLEAIAAGSELRTYEGHEAIVAFGEIDGFFCVLVSGHAEISTADAAGERTVIGKLEAGDVFGELPLLTGEPAAADIIACNRCFVLRIPRDVFSREIVPQPAALTFLSRLLAEEVRTQATEAAVHGYAPVAADDPYALKLRARTPGRILVVNAGPGEIRFGVFDTEDERRSLHGIIENWDQAEVSLRLEAGGISTERRRAAFPLDDLFKVIADEAAAFGERLAFRPHDIVAVGHRVVHGGSRYASATLIDDRVIADIKALAIFAPYHNPMNLAAIRAARKYFPDVPQVAVFDTAFHQTLPTYAYLYGLPYDYYKKEGIRRYGFHGSSHRYVSLKAAEVTRRPAGELEVISCHLGIGASLCAIDHGRSVDTTMGMTPAEGLVMAKRAGSMDPAVMIHLMKHYGMDPDALSELINAESGLKGISGLSADIREIEAAADQGHHRALLAHKTFCYQIRKNIGAFAAAMGGVDVLAFTGQIGETSAAVRSLACQGLDILGIRIDEEKNRCLDAVQDHADISAPDSRVKVLVIAANDERLVAWETLRAIERDQASQTLRQPGQSSIPIEISAHHVHLSQADVEKLFGPGHQLTPEHELSQPGQYACAEKVHLVGPKGRIANVRVLGPSRRETQVEIAMTEQFKLGVQPPIRESGDLAGTPGITLEGDAGSVVLGRGVICAQRHIHMSPSDAKRFGVRDRYVVRVRIEGERELIFGDVVVRVDPNFRLAMHIDTDEGNAANLHTGMAGYIDEIQVRR